ncbi:MAG: futalosine hydrolase, partial [Ferruginibacter sp.]
MKIILCAATKQELLPVIEHFNLNEKNYTKLGNHSVKLLILGAGILSSAFHLQKQLHEDRPDVVMLAGIAGAINPTLKLAEVVFVDSEFLGDFGAEAPDDFLNAFELNFLSENDFPFSNAALKVNKIDGLLGFEKLKSVESITVQKVHGSDASIELMKKKFPTAEIENMEGAAVYYVSKMMHVDVIQIRSISNYVEKRNREAWD